MTTAPDAGPSGLPAGLAIRVAAAGDVAACATIWRDALNDYMVRLNLPEIPDELGPIRRLHGHVQATDPDLFVVAAHDDGPPVGFAAAVRRGDVWFLSMLFVRPADQGRGIGPALLRRVLPPNGPTGPALAVATDSAQPISNALYASLGIVPRLPLLSLVGRVERPEALGRLPAGVEAVPFDAIAAGPPGGDGHLRLVRAVEAIDREVAGFEHPQDHRFLRTEGRRGFLFQAPDGTPVGYGYASEVGRVGPVAVRDAELMPAVLGHLLAAVEPRGASAIWVPGAAGEAVTALLRSGLRLDGFPVLLCWSRPFADLSRYLPISPGLL